MSFVLGHKFFSDLICIECGRTLEDVEDNGGECNGKKSLDPKRTIVDYGSREGIHLYVAGESLNSGDLVVMEGKLYKFSGKIVFDESTNSCMEKP